jgi:hypothetical protein
MIIIVLRCLAFLVGTLALYARFFMYEDEEGRWQNRIEKLWVAIDDRARVTGSKTSAFFNSVAAVVTRIFDRMFGPRLLSFRFVGVSSCYSFAGLFLLGLLVLIIMFAPSNPFGLNPVPTDLAESLPLLKWLIFTVGAVFLFLAVLPSLLSSHWPVALSLFPLSFFMFTAVLDFYGKLRHQGRGLSLFGALFEPPLRYFAACSCPLYPSLDFNED